MRPTAGRVKGGVFTPGYMLCGVEITETLNLLLCGDPQHAAISSDLRAMIQERLQRLSDRKAVLDAGLGTYTLVLKHAGVVLKKHSWPIPGSMHVAWALGSTFVDEAFVQEIVEWIEV